MSVEPPKKRQRISRACDLCRRRKVKCTYPENIPKGTCLSCSMQKVPCTFLWASKREKKQADSNKVERSTELLTDSSTDCGNSSDHQPLPYSGKGYDHVTDNFFTEKNSLAGIISDNVLSSDTNVLGGYGNDNLDLKDRSRKKAQRKPMKSSNRNNGYRSQGTTALLGSENMDSEIYNVNDNDNNDNANNDNDNNDNDNNDNDNNENDNNVNTTGKNKGKRNSTRNKDEYDNTNKGNVGKVSLEEDIDAPGNHSKKGISEKNMFQKKNTNNHKINKENSFTANKNETNDNSVMFNNEAGTPKVGNTNSTGLNLSKKDTETQKYDVLFKALLPGLPDIEDLNIEVFLKIYHNLKKSLNDNNYESSYSEKSMDYLKLATEQYKYYMEHKIPLENIFNSNFCLQIALPPKDVALKFVEMTSKECCVLFRVYHRPTFFKYLDELYSLAPMEYGKELIAFLPLCYSVMAVGALFSKSTSHGEDMNKKKRRTKSAKKQAAINDKNLDDEGYKYFIAARKMIDLTNARDLHSIQTIVMLFIFLQCSARISTCYLFIGVAMRSALREGLHRNIPVGTPGFTILDIEMRKRTFFSIYKMDIYINNMLGLPRTISQQDFDQTFPLEIEDEYITHEGIIELPPKTFQSVRGENGQIQYIEQDALSSAGIANYHTKLLMILDEVVEGLYPIKKPNNLISHEFVSKIELYLGSWVQQLPPALQFEVKDFSKFSKSKLKKEFYYKANRLLHLSFLQVQIVLYRPFIHYLTFNHSSNKYHLKPDDLSIKRAHNCLEVAKTVITLAKEMLENNLLSGNYWFSVYTIFFSVAGLIFYIHEFDPTNEEELLKYKKCVQLSKVGKQILDSLKCSSMAANRTYNLLNILFESLNRKTKTFMLQQHQRQLMEEQKLQELQQFTTSDFLKTAATIQNPQTPIQQKTYPNEQADFENLVSPSNDRNMISKPSIDSSMFNIEPTTSSVKSKVNVKDYLNTKKLTEQSLDDLYKMYFNNIDQFLNENSLSGKNDQRFNLSPSQLLNMNLPKSSSRSVFSNRQITSPVSFPVAHLSAENLVSNECSKQYISNLPSQILSKSNEATIAKASANIEGGDNFNAESSEYMRITANNGALKAHEEERSGSWSNDDPAMSITGVDTKNTKSSYTENFGVSLASPVNTLDQSYYSSALQTTLQKSPQIDAFVDSRLPSKNYSSQSAIGEVNANNPNASNKVNNGNDSNDENDDNLEVLKDSTNVKYAPTNMNTTLNTSETVNSGIEDAMYLTGVFDQLDMQLFGRFLPPYMSRANNISNNRVPDTTDANKEVSPVPTHVDPVVNSKDVDANVH